MYQRCAGIPIPRFEKWPILIGISIDIFKFSFVKTAKAKLKIKFS